MTLDERRALVIGAILGDSDEASLAWGKAIGALELEARALVPNDYDGICVHVIVHLDGRIVPLDFTGVEVRRFSKAKRIVVVAVAVPHTPEEAVADKRSVLVPLFKNAVAKAEAYFVKRKLASGLPEVRGVIESLA